MSTWTYDPTNDIGKVRLLIGDTDITPTSDAHFTDEEIQAMLTLYGDVLLAASYLLESWAASLSTTTLKSERIGDYSYSKDPVGDKIALAKKYRDEANSQPVSDIAEWDFAYEEETEG